MIYNTLDVLFTRSIFQNIVMTEVLILDQITTSDCREIGIEKAIWTLSSAKPGNGIEQLRDGNLETFWQSDGAQPHCINIQFINKVTINKLCIYLDYNLDESYTPKKIGIRAGTCTHDLIDITSIELQEPIGWVTMILSPLNEVGNGNEPVYLRTHFLQVTYLKYF